MANDPQVQVNPCLELYQSPSELSRALTSYMLGFDVQVYSDEEKARAAVKAFARKCGWAR